MIGGTLVLVSSTSTAKIGKNHQALVASKLDFYPSFVSKSQ